MNTKLSFRDFLWVLMTFLRGKVLRQKAYRPQGNSFPSMPGATVNRMLIFIDWWGYRPMTAKEAVRMMRMEKSFDSRHRISCHTWTDNVLSVNWLRSERDNSYRFLPSRRFR